MKGNEIIKMLGEIELPNIQCEDFRMQLRNTLIRKANARNLVRDNILGNIKSAVIIGTILISRLLKPQKIVWRMVSYSVIVCMLLVITAFLGVLPYFDRQSNIVLAVEIVENDPGIKLWFQGDDIKTVEVTGIDGNIASTIVHTNSGKTANVEVDVEEKSVKLRTITLILDSDTGRKVVTAAIVVDDPTPLREEELGIEEQEKVIYTLRSDTETREFLYRGATISEIYPVIYTLKLKDLNSGGIITITEPLTSETLFFKYVQAVLDLGHERRIITIQIHPNFHEGYILGYEVYTIYIQD